VVHIFDSAPLKTPKDDDIEDFIENDVDFPDEENDDLEVIDSGNDGREHVHQ
jgi:hypothetical protein